MEIISKELKKTNELTKSDERIPVVVFFSPCSEKELQTVIKQTYDINLKDYENEETYQSAVDSLIQKYQSKIGESSASSRLLDIIQSSSLDENHISSFIREKIPHGELLTDKTIFSYAQNGKSLSELMLLAYDLYITKVKRECIKGFISSKVDEINRISKKHNSHIEQSYSFLPFVIIKATSEEIAEYQELNFVTSIDLHIEKEPTPSLKLSNSNQVKMNISTSKANGYDGTGVTIGIVEAISYTDYENKKYVEGIDTNYRHLVDADITWNSYSLPAPYTKVGTSKHASQVASVIVGQNKKTWFTDYEGVVPSATVFGTSCSETTSMYNAIDYLIGKNVNIINMSLEYSDINEYCSIDEAIDLSAALHNITFVISAGNRRTESNPDAKISSPAHSYNAISVGNLNTTGSSPYSINTSSNYNQTTCPWETNKPDICASGTEITFSITAISTENNTGTSFATPYITGVVAQMMQANSGLKNNYTKIKALLTVSADNNTSVVSTSNSNSLISDSTVLRNRTGCGIVNAGIAVDMASRNCGTGVICDLSETQTIGQLFQVSSTALTAEAGQTVRMVLCFNKPEGGVVSGNYGNNINLGMYQSDTQVAMSSSVRNNVEIIQYTTSTRKTFNLRAFMANYIPNTSTTYLKVYAAYRIYD